MQERLVCILSFNRLQHNGVIQMQFWFLTVVVALSKMILNFKKNMMLYHIPCHFVPTFVFVCLLAFVVVAFPPLH